MLNDGDDRLTRLLGELKSDGWDVEGAGVSYPTLRDLARSAVIPAHQGADNVWRYSPRNKPAIAAALRLKRMTVSESAA